MASQTFHYQIDSGSRLEFATRDTVFHPTGTSSELIHAFQKFQKTAQRPGKTLDLGCGVGLVGIVLNHLGLVQPPLYASDLSQSAVELARENCRTHGCRVIAKEGSVFVPWSREKFDYIIDDISGVAESVAAVSPWFRNVPCSSGVDGTDLVIEVIRNAPRHLQTDGALFFPVLSLSNAGKILSAARESFAQVVRVSQKKWPLPESMKEHLELLRSLATAGLIQIEERFGMVLWHTEVFIATNSDRKTGNGE